ncbi:hypothetical protein AAY473_003437 [Plecturocebus cupreus]
MMVILDNCVTPDEKIQIRERARAHADSFVQANSPYAADQALGKTIPEQTPGMRKCMKKPVNYDKVREVTRAGEESPQLFYKAFRKRKLQKSQTGPQTPLSVLVEKVFKVFNRDRANQEEKGYRLIRKTKLLAVMISTPPHGNPKSQRKPETRYDCPMLDLTNAHIARRAGTRKGIV